MFAGTADLHQPGDLGVVRALGHDRDIVAQFIGKPLNLVDLQRKPVPRGHTVSPRDEDLARLVNEVSVGAASQVLPWHPNAAASSAEWYIPRRTG